MGFNTTLLILNDAMGVIDDDPAGWWAETKKHLYDAQKGEPVTFGHRGYANHFTVVGNYHADETVLMAVGGNYATILHRDYRGMGGGGGHHEPEDQLKLLKRAAEKHGYTLVRKRRPNGKVRR